MMKEIMWEKKKKKKKKKKGGKKKKKKKKKKSEHIEQLNCQSKNITSTLVFASTFACFIHQLKSDAKNSFLFTKQFFDLAAYLLDLAAYVVFFPSFLTALNWKIKL